MVKRDIGKEILKGLREIRQGGGRQFKVESLVENRAIREKMGLSQLALAGHVDVSLRTL